MPRGEPLTHIFGQIARCMACAKLFDLTAQPGHMLVALGECGFDRFYLMVEETLLPGIVFPGRRGNGLGRRSRMLGLVACPRDRLGGREVAVRARLGGMGIDRRRVAAHLLDDGVEHFAIEQGTFFDSPSNSKRVMT